MTGHEAAADDGGPADQELEPPAAKRQRLADEECAGGGGQGGSGERRSAEEVEDDAAQPDDGDDAWTVAAESPRRASEASEVPQSDADYAASPEGSSGDVSDDDDEWRPGSSVPAGRKRRPGKAAAAPAGKQPRSSVASGKHGSIQLSSSALQRASAAAGAGAGTPQLRAVTSTALSLAQAAVVRGATHLTVVNQTLAAACTARGCDLQAVRTATMPLLHQARAFQAVDGHTAGLTASGMAALYYNTAAMLVQQGAISAPLPAKPNSSTLAAAPAAVPTLDLAAPSVTELTAAGPAHTAAGQPELSPLNDSGPGWRPANAGDDAAVPLVGGCQQGGDREPDAAPAAVVLVAGPGDAGAAAAAATAAAATEAAAWDPHILTLLAQEQAAVDHWEVAKATLRLLQQQQQQPGMQAQAGQGPAAGVGTATGGVQPQPQPARQRDSRSRQMAGVSPALAKAAPAARPPAPEAQGPARGAPAPCTGPALAAAPAERAARRQGGGDGSAAGVGSGAAAAADTVVPPKPVKVQVRWRSGMFACLPACLHLTARPKQRAARASRGVTRCERGGGPAPSQFTCTCRLQATAACLSARTHTQAEIYCCDCGKPLPVAKLRYTCPGRPGLRCCYPCIRTRKRAASSTQASPPAEGVGVGVVQGQGQGAAGAAAAAADVAAPKSEPTPEPPVKLGPALPDSRQRLRAQPAQAQPQPPKQQERPGPAPARAATPAAPPPKQQLQQQPPARAEQPKGGRGGVRPGRSCAECGTTETGRWRIHKVHANLHTCNACYEFFGNHGGTYGRPAQQQPAAAVGGQKKAAGGGSGRGPPTGGAGAGAEPAGTRSAAPATQQQQQQQAMQAERQERRQRLLREHQLQCAAEWAAQREQQGGGPDPGCYLQVWGRGHPGTRVERGKGAWHDLPTSPGAGTMLARAGSPAEHQRW